MVTNTLSETVEAAGVATKEIFLIYSIPAAGAVLTADREMAARAMSWVEKRIAKDCVCLWKTKGGIAQVCMAHKCDIP
jgi:hypothetical protein